MPPLVSLRNDVSEEQTRQKFDTGVSCVTAQMGSAFDWLKQIFLEARSIRSPTQFSGSTAEAFLRLVFTSDGVGVGVVSGVVRALMT